MKISFALFVLLLFPAATRAETYTCKLDNSFLTREIIADKSGPRTTLFINKLTGKKYAPDADEFRFSMDNGAANLTAADFTTTAFNQTGDTCTFDVASKQFGVTATISYGIGKGGFWTQKKITLDAGTHLVNEIDVERFKLAGASVERFDSTHESKPPWDWPGGRPLFVDRQLFMGLEYPAGYNDETAGLFTLRHYPGRPGRIEAKSAVIGVAADRIGERVEDAFRAYLDTIRYHAPRRFILWNGYFHKYSGDGDGPSDTYSTGMLEKKMKAGKKAFKDVGVQLDAVLIDGGWTDPRSLMEEDRRAPGRIKMIRDMAAKYLNAPIGVHVITHGIRSTIDKKWLAQNFDMIDKDAYCYADNRAADLEIKNLLDDLSRHSLVAFKFDWGRFACDHADHRGHIPGAPYGREAITDNQIRMLSALHAASPDAFLYNTGWYSPWWLMHYEAVFAGEDDYNTALTGPPSFSKNDLQVTWRDAVIMRNITAPRSQFPLEALMNHSPVNWHWNHDYEKFEQGNIESFTNMILMNFLRGNGLIEFYYNVFNLTGDERRAWGAVATWAKSRDSILLADSRRIGGEPFSGQTYGYAHFTSGNHGVIGVRNPAITASEITITLDENIGYRQGLPPSRIRMSYPREEELGENFRYGDTLRLPLERTRVAVLEIEPVDNKQLAAPDNPRLTVPEPVKFKKESFTPGETGTAAEYTVEAQPGVATQFVLLVTMDSFTKQKEVSLEAAVDGTAAKAARTENCTGKPDPTFNYEPHGGWVLYTIPLAPGQKKLSLKISYPGGAAAKAWLMAESELERPGYVFSTGLPVTAPMYKIETPVF